MNFNWNRVIFAIGSGASLGLVSCQALTQLQSSPAPSPSASAAAAKPSPSPASKPPLTVQKLKNTKYYILASGPVTLKDGKAEDAEKHTFTLGDVVAYGDLNKDGTKDAIAPLTIGIGDRRFVYLVSVINDAGKAKNVGAQFVGENFTVKELTANAGKVVAKLEQPGVTITRTYEFKEFKSAAAPKASPAAKPQSTSASPAPSPQPSP